MVTTKFALHVFSGAGFGVPFTWESSDQVWPRHKLSFREAVRTVVGNLFAIILVPKILRKLPTTYFRKLEDAYNDFGVYMRELLEREKLGKDSDGNLLSTLVQHSATENGADEEGVLHDQEIIGNTFILLVAGHETV